MVVPVSEQKRAFIIHATGSQRVVVVARRLFVQFLFYLQGVDLPLCSSVKTCCAVEAFIQVEVVMQVFRHAMPHCCLSQRNRLGSTVAAGLEGTFYLSKDSAIPVYVTLSNCAWMHLYMWFQGSMSHSARVCLRTALWPLFEPAHCHWSGNDLEFSVQVAGWARLLCLQSKSRYNTTGSVSVNRLSRVKPNSWWYHSLEVLTSANIQCVFETKHA